MKDIKFRYWDPFNQMMFRSEVTHLADFFRDYELALYGDNNPVLMQFTGLQDTNGRDIYEGDIVRFTVWWFDGIEQESVLIGTIVYSNKCMSYQLKGVKNKEWEQYTGYENDVDYLTPFSELNFSDADFEVISNIYETAEMEKS